MRIESFPVFLVLFGLQFPDPSLCFSAALDARISATLTEIVNEQIVDVVEGRRDEDAASSSPAFSKVHSLAPFLKPLDYDEHDRERLLQEMEQSVTGVGFFLITDHGINPNLIERAHEESLRFFLETSQSEKKKLVKYTRDGKKLWRGYTVNESISSFNGRKPERSDPIEKYTVSRYDNPWPKHTSEEGENEGEEREQVTVFQRVIEEYYEEVNKLSNILVGLLEKIMGVEVGTIRKILGHDLGNGFLRLAHYSPQNSTSEVAGAHTDLGTVTVVSATAPGLEVLVGKEEDEEAGGRRNRQQHWESVPYLSPYVLAVNLGDLFRVWTNGKFPSVIHRVRSLETGTSRSSLIYFADTGVDLIEEQDGERQVIVEALEPFRDVTSSGAPSFGTVDYKALIREKRGRLLAKKDGEEEEETKNK